MSEFNNIHDFKILNSPQEVIYLCEKDEDSIKNDPYYYMTQFSEYTKDEFLKELEKHAEIKKQAGYSKKRDCDYISLVLVRHDNGDGEFSGHGIESTCLIKKNHKIIDSNNKADEYGEVGHDYYAAYHQLPDGKLVEYLIKHSYEEDLENIYKVITKVRINNELAIELPVNNPSTEHKRIKL